MSKPILVYKTGTTPFFPLSLVAANYSLPFQRSIGIKDKFSYILFVAHKKSYNWFLTENDIKRIGNKINYQIYSNGGYYFNKCNKQADKAAKELSHLTAKICLPGAQVKWTVVKTINFFQQLFPLYRQYGYWTDTVSFAMQMNGLRFFQDKLYKYLKSEQETKREYIFNLLTCYSQNTFSKKSDIELLKIALLPTAKQTAALKKHTKKYYWLVYDYFGDILDEKYFQIRLKQLSAGKSAGQIKQLAQKWQAEPAVKAEKINKIIDKYKISAKLADSFQSIRDYAYLYSETKKSVLNRVNITIRNVLAPLAQAREIDLLDLYFLTEREIIKFIKGEEIVNLTSRKEHCSHLAINGSYNFLQGKEEKKYLANIKEFIQNNEQVKKIKGQTANRGKVRGKVKLVLNASQISKVEEGDILVAPFTTVSYVPAMEKAAAIITDLGGITSHAAIISRELKIPCIIGTKIATRVLKDGDLVEVDADKGVVRILSKNKRSRP